MAGSYATYSEMLRNEKGRRKRRDSTQRDMPPNGSKGEAPSIYYTHSKYSDPSH